MWKLPSGPIEPAAFVDGGTVILRNTYQRVLNHYRDYPEVKKEWEDWIACVPQSDDVEKFLERFPEQFVIPFKDILFNDDYKIPDMSFDSSKSSTFSISSREQFIAGDCVQVTGQKALSEPPLIPDHRVDGKWILDIAAGKALHENKEFKASIKLDMQSQILNNEKKAYSQIQKIEGVVLVAKKKPVIKKKPKVLVLSEAVIDTQKEN